MVVIVGGGEAGFRLARGLEGEARVVEAAESAVRRLQEAGIPVVHGDGTDPAVLEEAGVREAAAVAALTGSDAANLAVAWQARFAFGVARVLARVNATRHAWLFVPEMGVDVAVDQSEVITERLREAIGV